MDRSTFLARVRLRLAQTQDAPIPHPPARLSALPAVRYAGGGEPLLAQFLQAASDHGALVRTAHHLGQLTETVSEICDRHKVRTAVVSGDPEANLVRPVLGARGIEVVAAESFAETAEADLGVTGATHAIATTGSVVVDSARAGDRTTSLLPPAHLAVVPASHIVPTPSDLWGDLPRHYPGGLPSQVVFITGPSKSADIEFTLTVGVHGPKSLWIAVLTDR